MVVLDSDTKEQRLYKGRLQYEYYNSEDLSDESEHVATSSVQAPGLLQSSIPAYDAKAEPWCIQCVDCMTLSALPVLLTLTHLMARTISIATESTKRADGDPGGSTISSA